ncbi:MAG: SdrD B-like domain-containing protein, partial [Candidatus Promineifilaceae bacterium]|nr:SdrD B-like domain-containing protein [Candidatus Promineifilaceae bacterium]
QYELLLAPDEQFRLEFTGIPDYLQPGVVSNSTEATVAFVSGQAANVNVALNNPAHYCQDNPELGTPCYLFGDQTQELPALISFHNRAGSTKLDDPFLPAGDSPYDDANSDVPGIQVHPVEATADQIGTTNGMAYQRSADVLFTAAFMKRHSGFGPSGTGAIYRIERSTGTVSTYVDFNAIFGPNTTGADPHDSSHLSDAEDVIEFFLHDPSFDQVAKISLGDVEISEDEKYLYTVNLNNKVMYRVPVVDAAAPALGPADISQFALPMPGNCPAADVRPFALAINDGKLYAGMVCSAQTSQNRNDLRAYVYSFDGSSFAPQPVIDFRLNYPRQCADRVPGTEDCGPQQDNKDADWNPWIGTFGELLTKSGTASLNTPRRLPIYPQPLLTDIEFSNGYMILGLRDRNGDLLGNGAFDPRDANGDPIGFSPDMSSPSTFYLTVAAGDILAAAPDSDRPWQWKLENNASVGGLPATNGQNNGNGPGGGEYFFEENFAISENFPRHAEIAQGGLANVRGLADAMTTSFNPIPIEDPSNFFDGGVIWLGGDDGQRTRSYRVFAGEGPPDNPPIDISVLLQGKNNGLGDLEVFCEAAPLEIGDRVWLDSNGNGIQDPGEPPLAGVSVQLYAPDMTTLLATAVTNATGNYYFSNGVSGPLNGQHAVYGVDGLRPNTAGYKLRIDMTQPVIANNDYVPTTPNADGHIDNNNKTDLRDSDAILVGETSEIMFDTGGAGHNNHTLDFGFVDAQEPLLVAIGNRVWLDDGKQGGTAGDGIVNGGEMGAAGVEVQLYPSSGVSGSPLFSTETDANGCYLFDNLSPGGYIVHIPASQFTPGAGLHGLISSLPEGGDTAQDDDMDENGQNTAVNGGTSSTIINLGLGSEPVGEPSRSLCASVQPDANENMTVDFGFTIPVPGIAIIKKTNGLDANEPVLPGVPQIPPGETVTWTYEVENTGNISFPKADVIVTDSQGEVPVFDSVIIGDSDDFLNPGEIWQYKATGTAEIVGLPEVAGEVPRLWGIDEDKAALFSIEDYTQIGAGPAAAGLTVYGLLLYTDADGVTQPIGRHIGSFTIDTDNVAYMAYNQDLTVGASFPPLPAPVLMTFDLNNATTTGDNIVNVIGSIPIPGFDPGAATDDNISGMSLHPATDQLFALYRVTDGPTPDRLLLVDKETGALLADIGEMRNDSLGAIVEDGEALEFDRAGNLYVSDNWDDELYLVDPQTAQITTIVDNNQLGGLTGISRLKTEGLAWDPLSQTMVAADDLNDLFYIQSLENGNNMSLGSFLELTDVEAIDFLLSCYVNVGQVSVTVTAGETSDTISDFDLSHYCN